jgi:hypothetical protein
MPRFFIGLRLGLEPNLRLVRLRRGFETTSITIAAGSRFHTLIILVWERLPAAHALNN